MDTVRKEPAITVGAIGALIGAVLITAKTFGLPITPDQEDAIKDLVLIAGPIIGALIVRARVTPV